jgi:transcriptional regulator with XRE-family HTH domain
MPVLEKAGDFAHLYDMRNDWIKHRIRELRSAGKNVTQGSLADAIGVEQPRISEIIAGRRTVRAAEARSMAAYLELPESVVLARLEGDVEVDTPANQWVPLKHIMVVGAVQAGVYGEALEWPDQDWYPAPIGAFPSYERYMQRGLLVRGESMNELYPDGSIVACVKYIDLGRDPIPGERVVVMRAIDGFYEATLKEIRQAPDGTWWLWPRSTHPSFQQPWQLTDDEGEWNENLRVVAKVVGCYRPEP